MTEHPSLEGCLSESPAGLAWAFFVFVKGYIQQAFYGTVFIKHSREFVSGEGL